MADVTTNPGDTGPNPNINTTISFTMKLPSNSLFCPKLTCYVYDYVYSLGWSGSQPLIGTFSINLGTILDETLKIQKEKIDEANSIKKALMAALEGRDTLEADKSAIMSGSISPAAVDEEFKVSLLEHDLLKKKVT